MRLRVGMMMRSLHGTRLSPVSITPWLTGRMMKRRGLPLSSYASLRRIPVRTRRVPASLRSRLARARRVFVRLRNRPASMILQRLSAIVTVPATLLSCRVSGLRLSMIIHGRCVTMVLSGYGTKRTTMATELLAQ